jgi:hypothetical protein
MINMKRIIITFIFLCLALCNSNAQTTDTTDFPPIPIGAWRQHLPWQRARSVAQSAQHVYFATEWAVAQIDKSDPGRTPRFLTKVEGLSDAGIEFVRFNRATNTLVIAYTNSNLDLWSATDGLVTNLPFILRNTNLAGRRKLNDMMFEGNNAYLAGAFGLLKLDLTRREVVYTTFSDEPALAVTVYNGFIYLATLEGLFRLPVNDVNPADFGRWQLVSGRQGIPSGAVSALAVSQGRLFFSIGRTVYQFDGTTTSVLVSDPAFSVVYLTGEGEGLVIGYRQGFSGRVVYRNAAGTVSNVQTTCEANIPLYALEDGRGRFWMADLSEDFRYYDLAQDKCDRFRFNSPFNEFSTEIAIQGDRVFVATPGGEQNLNPRFGFWGVYIYENGQWRRFNGDTNPNLKAGDCDRDWWRVAPHPTIRDKFYVGSFVGGLVEATKDGATARCFNQNNSTLQNAGASGASRTAIGGMAFDKTGNLWICNYDARSPIAVLKPDGKFLHFPGRDQASNLIRVTVDNNDYKWFVAAFNGGVLVYDSGKDLDATNDDRYRLITSTTSQLQTNTVNCVAPDLEGDVWVGTQQGVVVFDCGDVFNPNCVGSRRPITIDGFNAYLLETEDVRAIAVDGANRKWCGTTNGIFVLSSDGKTELARITRSNSPLFDNTITSLAINPKTGEVWIGTEKGIQSLRTDATTGGRINSPSAYAYPNPVPPDYDGPIAIYGLARDANVKITDVTGNLVYEGTALGGQAVWNGRDYLGRRAASGVYLIYATSSTLFDTPDAIIVKVVVLR